VGDDEDGESWREMKRKRGKMGLVRGRDNERGDYVHYG
jgi:hypothetical protein